MDRVGADTTSDGDTTDTSEDLTGSFNDTNEVISFDDTDPNPDVTYPFDYDDAGNVTEKALTDGGATKHVYTHDAWNRLVRVELDDGTNVITVTEYDYAANHSRLVKRINTDLDTSDTIDEERWYFYSAAWQLLEEHVDTNLANGNGDVDERYQNLWGLRYVDDAVMRRHDPSPSTGWGDTDESTWYYLTDAQFNVVALLDDTGAVVERVSYDAYGRARHHFAYDVDGDGAIGSPDRSAVNSALGRSIGNGSYNVHADFDRDGTVTSTDLANVSTQNYQNARPPGVLSDVGNIVGYAGYLYDEDVSLYVVRFRWYDPEFGRWLQRDPLGYVDGASLYEYVASAPTTFLDPMGLYSGKEDYEEWVRENGQPTVRPALPPGQKLQPPGSSLQLDGIGQNGIRCENSGPAIKLQDRNARVMNPSYWGSFGSNPGVWAWEMFEAVWMGSGQGLVNLSEVVLNGGVWVVNYSQLATLPGFIYFVATDGGLPYYQIASFEYAKDRIVEDDPRHELSKYYIGLGLSALGFEQLVVARMLRAGAAAAAKATRAGPRAVHKNSLDYVGETHVYRVRGPDGSTYKIGESAQGVRVRDGASIRAEQQARRLTRETGDVYTTETRRTFPDKASARDYETRLIERFRRMYGPDTLPGNKTNR